MVKKEKRDSVRETAEKRAEDHLLQLLVPGVAPPTNPPPTGVVSEPPAEFHATREKFRERLRAGKLDHRTVEIEVEDTSAPSFEMFTPQGVEEVGINLKDMLPGMFGRRQKQTVTVAQAREILVQQEPL